MSYLGQVELKSSEIRRIDVTGSTSATHTLTWTPASEQSLIITINGIKQQNNYSISGVTLTLDDALLSADKMEVIGILDIGEAVVPPDDSISTAKIQDDAVTADKLANSINTEIAANTAKVTNATHTGDVTGATALTIATDAVDIAMLSATGTASATTFLRGDNAWASSIMANGTVLQVVSESYSTKVTFTLSDGIYAGWEASITPSSTSNKILVLGTFETSSAGAGRVQVNIKWDTSSGVDSGSQITQFTQGGYDSAASTNSLYNQTFNALVSTSSTSQLYFKPIAIKHDGGTGYLNFYGAHSTLTLMEIKA